MPQPQPQPHVAAALPVPDNAPVAPPGGKGGSFPPMGERPKIM